MAEGRRSESDLLRFDRPCRFLTTVFGVSVDPIALFAVTVSLVASGTLIVSLPLHGYMRRDERYLTRCGLCYWFSDGGMVGFTSDRSRGRLRRGRSPTPMGRAGMLSSTGWRRPGVRTAPLRNSPPGPKHPSVTVEEGVPTRRRSARERHVKTGGNLPCVVSRCREAALSRHRRAPGSVGAGRWSPFSPPSPASSDPQSFQGGHSINGAHPVPRTIG